MTILISALLFTFTLAKTLAFATDSICHATAIRDTTKTDYYSFPLKRDDVIDAITQYNVNKKTGQTSYCSHGGGCYPSEALQLTNCEVDKSPFSEDNEDTMYGLTVIRSKVPADILRQNDVELKLLNLGMCNGCADNAAAFYVKQPDSQCARLVRGALEGNPIAVESLKDTPDYCLKKLSECAGILHGGKYGLRFGGGKGEGEGLCVIRKSDEREVLATCTIGRFCRVEGNVDYCKDMGECVDITNIISVKTK